eukprot:4490384-Amphidinium_carterae.1
MYSRREVPKVALHRLWDLILSFPFKGGQNLGKEGNTEIPSHRREHKIIGVSISSTPTYYFGAGNRKNRLREPTTANCSDLLSFAVICGPLR